MEDYKEFLHLEPDPQKIKAVRKAIGVRQEDVARFINVRPSTYSAYEQATRKIPIKVFILIANVLGVDPVNLLKNPVHEKRKEYQKELSKIADSLILKDGKSTIIKDVELTDEVIYVMREKIKTLMDNIDHEDSHLFFKVSSAFFSLFEIYPIFITSNLNIFKETIYKNLFQLSTRDISLFIHAFYFTTNTVEYLKDPDNIFVYYYKNSYILKEAKLSETFIFPPPLIFLEEIREKE